MRNVIALTFLSLILICPPILGQERIARCGNLIQSFVWCVTFESDSGVGYNLGSDDPEIFDGFGYDDRIFISGTILTGYFTFCFFDLEIVDVDQVRYCNDCCIERGDVDGIGKVNILDLTYTIDFIFRGAEQPTCGL